MAILKGKKSHATTGKIEEYIKNPEKTDEKSFFAHDCSTDNFTSDFDLARQSYGKCLSDSSVKYAHFIVSFDKSVSADEVKFMAQEYCKNSKISCYQYFGCVHTDHESHGHAHIVVSNVATKTEEQCNVKEGNSFQLSKNEMREMKVQINQMCLDRGHLDSITQVDRKSSLTRGEQEMMYHRNAMPWKEELRNNIAQASLTATTYEEFKEQMENKFHTKVEQDKKGNIRYTPQNFKESRSGKIKSVSEKRLGEEYSKDELSNTWQENKELIQQSKKDSLEQYQSEKETEEKQEELNSDENPLTLEEQLKDNLDQLEKLYQLQPESQEEQAEWQKEIEKLEMQQEVMEIQMKEQKQEEYQNHHEEQVQNLER